jgi:hypothetical protein
MNEQERAALSGEPESFVTHPPAEMPPERVPPPGDPIAANVPAEDDFPRPKQAYGSSSPVTYGDQDEISANIEILARVALEQDDPVSALEEGATALAEMLALRDREREGTRQLTQARDADLRDAYAHARLHRVGELVDMGYSLDQAIPIANTDEREIRMRAAQAGLDGAEIIYRYAILHGYQPQTASQSRMRGTAGRIDRLTLQRRTQLEALATMGDEEFAAATRGARWQELLG